MNIGRKNMVFPIISTLKCALEAGFSIQYSKNPKEKQREASQKEKKSGFRPLKAGIN